MAVDIAAGRLKGPKLPMNTHGITWGNDQSFRKEKKVKIKATGTVLVVVNWRSLLGENEKSREQVPVGLIQRCSIFSA